MKHGKRKARIALRDRGTCLARVDSHTFIHVTLFFYRFPDRSSFPPSLSLSPRARVYSPKSARPAKIVSSQFIVARLRPGGCGGSYPPRNEIYRAQALDHRRIHRPATASAVASAVNTRLHRNDALVLAPICSLPIGQRHRIQGVRLLYEPR